MDPIEEKPIELPVDTALEERVAALELAVAQIQTNLSQVQTDVVNAVKIEETPLQLVVEKEGTTYKARRKMLVQSATETKEKWEDVTNEFTQEELEDKLNGA